MRRLPGVPDDPKLALLRILSIPNQLNAMVNIDVIVIVTIIKDSLPVLFKLS